MKTVIPSVVIHLRDNEIRFTKKDCGVRVVVMDERSEPKRAASSQLNIGRYIEMPSFVKITPHTKGSQRKWIKGMKKVTCP